AFSPLLSKAAMSAILATYIVCRLTRLLTIRATIHGKTCQGSWQNPMRAGVRRLSTESARPSCPNGGRRCKTFCRKLRSNIRACQAASPQHNCPFPLLERASRTALVGAATGKGTRQRHASFVRRDIVSHIHIPSAEALAAFRLSALW